MFAVLLFAAVLPVATNAQLAGGVAPITLSSSDPNVLFGLAKIKSSMNLADSNLQSWKLESATSQVVAGTLYRLKFSLTIGQTEQKCEVEVWSRPWLTGDAALQVTQEPKCDGGAATRQLGGRPMVGGATKADINDPTVKSALNFAVKMYNGQVNYMFSRKPVIDNEASVTKQVVNGIKYVFSNIDMADTSCMNNGSDLDKCDVTDNGTVKTCSFTVVEQAWMDAKYRLIASQCN